MFEDFGINIKNIVNIAYFTKVILPHDFISPFVAGVGLSSLTGLVLGKSVDKTSQTSLFLPPYSQVLKECE
jgi:hypothetical protein